MRLFDVIVDGKSYSSLEEAARAVEDDLNRSVSEGFIAVSREMRKALDGVYDSLERKHGDRWPTGGNIFGTSPDRLGRRSGSGLRSIRDSVQVVPGVNDVTGQITTGKMTIHETGAVIRAKRAKYLTLPMIQALDSRGLPRKRSAREWRDTFIARSKRGNLIIFQKRTGGKVVPLYLLKKKVTMPRRLGMQKTFEDMVPHFTAKAVKALEAALA